MTNKYFAEIDSDSIVIRVVSAESKDQCESNYGGAWVETWKDGSQRFHFACVGSPYNERLDAFVPNNDFQGWILNEETIEWEPPTPMPEPPVGDLYFWCNECEDWKLESEVPESEIPLR
ncbi:hypothetical protein [Planktomarina sp.]|uniref:hypothetical protein n=1 Tax=Planktomarina sp. TaxID=2024851 RepID=UPI0032615C00